MTSLGLRLADHDRMVAWRPPSISPTASSVASAGSPCGSRSTSPSTPHTHTHGHKHRQLSLGSHHHVHGSQQERDPLSPPLSRPLSPVLILPHSAAIPTATYQHPPPRMTVKPSQVALPATPPPSPDAFSQPLSSAAVEAEEDDRFVDSPLSASPRPSLRRLDTPVFVSPRDPDVSEAVLRVGAWVGLTASTAAALGRQATV